MQRVYIFSPPKRSPGKNELRDEGVARCGSGVSNPDGGAPHKADDHSWLEPAFEPQVSVGVAMDPALLEFCIGLL